MVLSRTSLPVRYYAFLLRIAGNEREAVEYRLSRVTDLCQFVRAIIFRSVAVLAGVAGVLSGFTLIALIVYKEPMALLITIAGAAAVICIFAGAVMGTMKVRKYLRDTPENSGNVAVVYLKAVKRGICPMLKIEQR